MGSSEDSESLSSGVSREEKRGELSSEKKEQRSAGSEKRPAQSNAGAVGSNVVAADAGSATVATSAVSTSAVATTAVGTAGAASSGPANAGSEQSAARPARAGDRRNFRGSLEDLFISELPRRTQQVDLKLRQQLAGSILLVLQERNSSDRSKERRYFFDWTTDQLKSGVYDETALGGKVPDCTIVTSELVLGKILVGDLNPQITMLSDKMRVEGKLSLAVYFFNLLTA